MTDAAPPSSKFQFLSRSGLILLEIITVMVVLALLAGGLLVWRLSHGPIDIDFARRHLEAAINNEIAPYRVQSGSIDLEWDNVFERPSFNISNIEFLNEQDQRILNIQDLQLALSRSAIITGDIQPRRIIVNGLDLHVLRRENGDIQLGFVSGPNLVLFNTLTDTAQSGPDMSAVDLRKVFENHVLPVRTKTFLKGLRRFAIKNAAIVYEDMTRGQAMSMPNVNAGIRINDKRLQIEGQIIMPGSAGSSQEGRLEFNSTYFVDESKLVSNIGLSEFNPFLWSAFIDSAELDADKSSIRLNGQGTLEFSNNMDVAQAFLALTSSKGYLSIPILYDKIFPLDSLKLNVKYAPETRVLSIHNSNLSAYGVNIGFGGSYPFADDQKEAFDIPLYLGITEMALPLAEPAFPDKLEHEKIYEILTQQIKGGIARNVKLKLVLAVAKSLNPKDHEVFRTIDMGSLDGKFSFEGLTMDYRSPLMPVSEATGYGTLDFKTDTLTIKAATGKLQDLNVKDIEVKISKLFEKGKDYLDISLALNGPLKTLLEYLSPEPINLGEKFDFDVSRVRGTADATVKVGLPTTKDLPLEEVNIEVSGTGTDVFIPGLVKGLDVSGGPGQLTIKDGLITVKGAGQLSARPVDFTWQQYLISEGKPFMMKIDAGLRVDLPLLEHFGVGVKDYMDGTAYANVVYTDFQDGRAEVKVSADLNSSRLMFEPLGYDKPVGQNANISLNIFLQDEQIERVEDMDITGPDLDVKDAKMTFKNGHLNSGSFPSNVIGQTKAVASFDYPAPDFQKLKIDGEALNISALLNQTPGEPYDGPAVQSTINVDKLITRDALGVSKAKLFVDMDKTGTVTQFEMDGKVGKGSIYARYRPDEKGRYYLRARVSDAGAALDAFDIYRGVEGGALTLTAAPAEEVWRGNLNGKMLMENFSVTDAPILARLISSLSIPGLGDLLSNEGIGFTKMESDFEWRSRPEGSLINIKDGRTAGSELGLTFIGQVDRAKGTVDLSGTIVPVSSVNNLVGSIPLVGDIITGGGGALFAATYTIKGPAKDSKVSVNPLSVLTPGILRKIFFEE